MALPLEPLQMLGIGRPEDRQSPLGVSRLFPNVPRTGDRAETNVTQKMVDAGLDVLMDFEWGWVKPSEHVERIFRAMAAAASQDD